MPKLYFMFRVVALQLTARGIIAQMSLGHDWRRIIGGMSSGRIVVDVASHSTNSIAETEE